MRLQQFNAVLVLLAPMAFAADACSEERIDFARHIQPLLQQHCTKCHGGVRRAGGLSLIGAGGKTSPGDSGQPLLVAGKPADSELWRRVTASDVDERMPAEGEPLAPAEIALLRRWIEEGAVWPTHWSFARVNDHSLPDVAGADWARTAIDRFVLHRLEASAVHPSRAADRYTLIRRLSLDLLGLPPTPEEADNFAAATTPDAYERLVDRLLASPHFGERWGRHWLDQARYADSDGYEVDKPRPTAYRWRDWVIAAVNGDLPLDQFTALQFAGDLLPGTTPEQHLATAYHRQTLTNNEGGVDKEEYRFKAVLDRVSNAGAVWLGLTLGCAHCHDHPYDAVTQREVYALAAIFNNADETEIELPGGASRGAQGRKLSVLSQRESPRITRILNRGDFLNPGAEVEPGVLQALHPLSAESSQSDHRPPVNRLDLAAWLVDPLNPLTPRVLSNQIWLRLFGQGLVRTPEDFGARGEPPTHPELLDWLSRELVTRGWSRKAIIRRVVASAAYRQSSRHRSDLGNTDSENRLLARQNRLRVEAELVRDLQLTAGGLLTFKVGGPSVFPPLGEEFVKITFRSELPWKTSEGEDRYRRGMYTFFKRSVPYPDLMLFDCPDSTNATVQRSVSNTPLQALAALNAETSVAAARGLARRAMQMHDDAAAVLMMFRVCLTRQPSSTETKRLVELLGENRRWYKAHADDAQAMAVEVVTGGADASSAAALVATASAIMNLDEFITRE